MGSPVQLEIGSTRIRTRSLVGYPYPLPVGDLLVLPDTLGRPGGRADTTVTYARAGGRSFFLAGILRLLLRAMRASLARSRIAAVSVACVCLAPVIAPCGDAEPSFDDQVRGHLVRSGYLSPFDVLRPFDGPAPSDTCRLARTPRNCSCVSHADRIAASSRT